jgi:PEGA domain
MRSHTLLFATAVLTAGLLANTADAAQRQRWGNGNGGGRQEGGAQGGGQGGGSRATPRAEPSGDRGGNRGGDRGDRGNAGGRREAPPPQARSTPPPQVQRVEPRAEASSEPRSRRAVPRYEGGSSERSTEGGANDGRTDGRTTARTYDGGRTPERTTAGRATDRRTYDTRTNDTRRDGSRVAVPRPYGRPPVRGDDHYRVRTYSSGGRSYYYSPRYYSYRPYYYYRPNYYSPFVFGYGPRGRGYFYFDVFYDSYVFYPRTIVRYNDYGRYGYPTGELRLDVEPRDAQVYIDGAYAGLVDDFDGVFQSLRLEVGEYQVEVVAPGFEPLVFEVRIPPGETVTYRGDLLPERP